ncbi:3'-5' exonuclease [Nonomuraea turcica]|uniref:3'-5' exonuclease n=1 Tax=Nonomuraea sp. G32 TaxID=3067274 RepID=UPI0035301601
MVNPERDLGAQHIHGIRAADVRHAPSFKDIAGALTELLRGRAPVAHNLRFDLGFLHDEYARAGTPILDPGPIGICTMTEAARFPARCRTTGSQPR